MNRIGGKIEHSETPLQAIQREFLEEAGFKDLDWKEIPIHGSNVKAIEDDVDLHFFAAEIDSFANIKTQTDEYLIEVNLSCLCLFPCVKNLDVIIAYGYRSMYEKDTDLMEKTKNKW